MTTRVHVAIYKKVDSRDAAHWAIWLEGANDHNRILQIRDDKDDKGYGVEEPLASRPDRSARLKETIECGSINAEHSLASLIQVVQARPVNNESTTWNCQNWVMDALDALARKKGLDIPERVKNNLMGKRENPKYENPQAKKKKKAGKPGSAGPSKP